MGGFEIQHGIAPEHIEAAAYLHFRAFRDKLGPVLGRAANAEAFYRSTMNPQFAISALTPDGTDLLGVAGFKTADGAFIGGTFSDLKRHYGFAGALWRGLVLSALDRGVEPDRLLMDGIAVMPEARGQGIGSALLEAIVLEAYRRGKGHVRLDVIDSNPRARALYERHGFVAGRTRHLGPLRHVFGFRSATMMLKSVHV
ncbi:MAG: GNAT family N-acetyltransferase [Hyphomicrobiaceae bacterium]